MKEGAGNGPPVRPPLDLPHMRRVDTLDGASRTPESNWIGQSIQAVAALSIVLLYFLGALWWAWLAVLVPLAVAGVWVDVCRRRGTQ